MSSQRRVERVKDEHFLAHSSAHSPVSSLQLCSLPDLFCTQNAIFQTYCVLNLLEYLSGTG